MPSWLITALKWGGLALVVIAAIALIVVQITAPTPEAGSAAAETTAPVGLYWVLMVIGVAAAIIGFVRGRGGS